MITISGKDFIDNIINVFRDNGITTIGSGDVLNYESYQKIPDDIKSLFYRFFYDKRGIGSKKFISAEFKDIYTLGFYYYFFFKANGYEPFDFASELYDRLHVGVIYKWSSDNFSICTKKKKINNKITVSFLCYANDDTTDLPMFDEEEEKEEFLVEADNGKFLDSLRRFNNIFESPFSNFCDDGLVEKIEESIKRNKNALKILKKIKSEK